MGEFELIRRHFQHPLRRSSVALGNGDDCALLAPAPGMQLAVSTDMLVAGRHFLPDVDPEALGHKALAVNLSDLAAMGARPLACTLALALPAADDAWLAAFARGLLGLADAHRCALVGGDTTAGPLNLCLTVFGEVPPGRAARRDAGRVGDDVYVSGTLGDARLALEGLLGHWPVPPRVLARTRARLERPTPRVALGLALQGQIHACADVSDGLLGDLGHILAASRLGAELDVPALLASAAVSDDVRALPPERAWTCVLAGGDDYELVFTAPPDARARVQAAAQAAATPVTRIGRLCPARPGEAAVRLLDAQQRPLEPPAGAQLGGFDHFG
ncbi:thiamine-phosphate kinase [Aquabacterium sp. A08]|uniref:thiamine-phosphate kinase n=1 Tax=Aquabacterium sp. A08 TaxID=2718532 RepID=UPI00142168AA|nr:thiamine-phosphate kinase [Aquabacterium sp. A08]NIC41343.1 thiamine-phosphate kinase [Aquabacterium sp. A08]NIC41352.1 thiamine-phosphate kinase [Aquabacterium sp. A08]